MFQKYLNETIYIIEHYHATDAGMKIIIDSTIQAIQRLRPHSFIVLLYSSVKYQDRPECANNPTERYISPGMPSLDCRGKDPNSILKEISKLSRSGKAGAAVDLPHLGYDSKKYSCPKDFFETAHRRKSFKIKLFQNMNPFNKRLVHHIHNPTLMKNPVETFTNYLVAAEFLDSEYIQLRHIHDLTEDTAERAKQRDLQRRVAGPTTEAVFGKNGAGVAWQSSPNIFYIAINKCDHESIIKGLNGQLDRKTIFYCPNPINVAELTQAPVFNKNGETLDAKLEKYCRECQNDGYRFDAEADLLLASEVARKRKNTGEQLLLLRMLNHDSKKTGLKYQLAVAMLPTSKVDKERIAIFHAYLKTNKQPVVMGFARDIFGRDGTVSDNKFHIRDLWNHPRAAAVVSTSTSEGFGLNFINPSVATYSTNGGRAISTIGRALPKVFKDLKACGVCLPKEAFYREILVDRNLIASHHKALIISDERLNAQKLIEDELIEKTYHAFDFSDIKTKGISLNQDFADYQALEQILLLGIIDYDELARRMAGLIAYIQDRHKMHSAAKKTAHAVIKSMALSKYLENVEGIIQKSYEYRSQRISSGENCKLVRDNSDLLQLYSSAL